MAEPTKIVKGGFRATLALLISIIALILSILAYNRTSDQSTFTTEIKNLQQKMSEIKKDTSEQLGKIRKETGNAIENMGKAIKKEESKQ